MKMNNSQAYSSDRPQFANDLKSIIEQHQLVVGFRVQIKRQYHERYFKLIMKDTANGQESTEILRSDVVFVRVCV